MKVLDCSKRSLYRLNLLLLILLNFSIYILSLLNVLAFFEYDAKLYIYIYINYLTSIFYKKNWYSS